MFWVYMIECSDGLLYIGHTDDLDRRWLEHQEGRGCKTTMTRLPLKLIWAITYFERDMAKEVEKRLKKWNRNKKLALARNDFQSLRHWAKKPRFRKFQ